MKQKWNVLVDGRGLDEDEIVDEVLKARGIDNPDDFFNPTEDDLIDFDEMKNLDEAYQIISNGINDGWNFVIHADVDCDGCTSAAIMYRYLKHYVDSIPVTINLGKKHGIHSDYNCSVIKDKTILIVVDSINENYDVIYDYASENNFDIKVVVLDHHIIPDNFDSRPVLISSANNYPNPQLSGAGVCLTFCQYFDYMELTDYANELYDLAACGLVADMVDMTVMENRYIVKRGLENLVNPGIKAVVGNYYFDSTAITFSVAPLVNAACRTFNDAVALRLFIEDDADKVKQIVESLKKCKEYQEDVIKEMMPDLIKESEQQINNKVATFIIEPRDDVSVAGLLGNRLCAELQKPVLVLNNCDDMYSGSARGIGINSFIDYAREQNIEFADGHENAFGIGIIKDNLIDIKCGLESALEDVEFVNEKTVDVQLDAEQITKELIDKFKYYSKVTGECFKPLTVCVKGISDATSKPMSGGKHMRMIKDGVNFIKWNSKDDMTGKTFDVVGSLDRAYWGRSWNYNVIIDTINVERME